MEYFVILVVALVISGIIFRRPLWAILLRVVVGISVFIGTAHYFGHAGKQAIKRKKEREMREKQ